MIPTFPVSFQPPYPVLKLELNTQNAVPVHTEKLKTALNIGFVSCVLEHVPHKADFQQKLTK
jgi:hypothetical protein